MAVETRLSNILMMRWELRIQGLQSCFPIISKVTIKILTDTQTHRYSLKTETVLKIHFNVPCTWISIV